MSRTIRHLLVIAALPALLGAAACGGSTADPITGDRTALLHAESQWNAAAIHNYNYDLVTSFAASHDSPPPRHRRTSRAARRRGLRREHR